MLLSTDVIKRFGWVVRGDKLIHADDLDIVAYIGNDGCSNRGGRVRMNLSTGEKFEAEFEPVAPAALFHHRGLCCVDTLSRVRWGDRIGWGTFETSANPQAGTRHPQVLDGGVATNGWHDQLRCSLVRTSSTSRKLDVDELLEIARRRTGLGDSGPPTSCRAWSSWSRTSTIPPGFATRAGTR